MDVSIKDIYEVSGELIAEAINRMRNGEVKIKSGYDGEYGKISLFTEKELQKSKRKLRG